MPSRANITILGHCAQPENKVLPDGTDVVSFSVATNAYSKGGDITSWWRVSVFGNRAKGLVTLINTGAFTKGTLVQVTGEVTQRPYAAADGSQRVSSDVRADSVEVIFAKGEQSSGGNFEDAPF